MEKNKEDHTLKGCSNNIEWKNLLPVWKKITKDNLPTDRVIALNTETEDIIAGIIKIDPIAGYYCKTTVVWMPCTHYLTMEEMLKLPIEEENI